MRRIILLVVAVLFVAGCGGDDDGGASDDATATTDAPTTTAEDYRSPRGGSESPTSTAAGAAEPAAAGATVEVTASGFSFQPDALAASRGEVTFDVTNEDDEAHTFTIEGAPVDMALAPKGRSSTTVTLEDAEYTFRCRIHGGMTGTLVVG